MKILDSVLPLTNGLKQKLQDFEEDVKALSDAITISTIEIFNSVTSQLLPTPVSIHYLFN